MKKILLGVLSLVFLFGQLQAQLAKKYVVIEQFTQASCGPCASENPGFRADVLVPNEGKVHHIAVHTSWPGTDPMYTQNTTQSADRVTYYGVTGVPTFETNGANIGVPGQEQIDTEMALGSPVSVEVKQTVNGSNLDVRVKVTTVGTVPSGSYVVRAAIVETSVAYATAPGTNGEKFFPNVFRRMLPSSSGSTYTPAAKGDSVVFNYSYAINSGWDIDSIKTVAFVQNTSTKKILNAGSNLDLPSEISNGWLDISGAAVAVGTPSVVASLTAQLINNGSANENFIVRLTPAHPSDWNVTFTVNGTTYTDSAVISIPGGTTFNADINVTPGTSAAVGNYTITMKSYDFPNTILFNKSVSVMSNVTELVVNSDSKRSNGPGTAANWQGRFLRGLDLAGSTTHGVTGTNAFIEFANANLLANVKNVYYNAGWTFPSLTDELVAVYTTFINNGGNFFISGQDIGWETMDAGGTGTTATKEFYTNVLKTQYVADGSSSYNSLRAFTTDYVYNGLANSSIFAYYGTGALFPDQIAPLGNSESIFYYTSTNTKIGGIRNFNPTTNAKIVYLGVGLEMLTDSNVAKNIMKRTYDWFNGQDCNAMNIEYAKTIACYNQATATIDADIYGGSGDYTYSWSNLQTEDSIGGLTAGTYTLTVTDVVTSCTREKQFVVKQATSALNLTATNNSTNMTATANPTGGTTPYTYSWDNGGTTKTITGLTPGTYVVVVTDANGCTNTASTTIAVTGIENLIVTTLTVQPNPFIDHIELTVAQTNENVKVSVHNILGEVIYEENGKTSSFNKTRIDMSNQPSGVYLVTVKGENETIVKKLIKK